MRQHTPPTHRGFSTPHPGRTGRMKRLTLIIEADDDGKILNEVVDFGEYSALPMSPDQIKGTETTDEGAKVSWSWEDVPADGWRLSLVVDGPNPEEIYLATGDFAEWRGADPGSPDMPTSGTRSLDQTGW